MGYWYKLSPCVINRYNLTFALVCISAIILTCVTQQYTPSTHGVYESLLPSSPLIHYHLLRTERRQLVVTVSSRQRNLLKPSFQSIILLLNTMLKLMSHKI